MKKRPAPSSGDTLIPRIIAIVLGLIALGLGWSAQSQGILFYTGRNARTGTESDSSTLSWVIYGALLILAGIFPWRWLSRHLKP